MMFGGKTTSLAVGKVTHAAEEAVVIEEDAPIIGLPNSGFISV